MTISVEGGAETAKRTFNPHIGVEGGLSILGTSGIVEPMSQQAILDTIQLEMNQAALRAKNAPGPRRLVLAPGNYGLDYLASALPQFERFPVVKTSNFIGDTLDMAATAKFEEVLLVGHVGKLCKLAAGVMNTHSHTADGRAEVFCAHAALCGAAHEVCAALMETSPMFSMATSCPASRYCRTAAAAFSCEAASTAGSRLMAKYSGTMVLPSSAFPSALRAMSSASIWPEAVCGAASTGHCRSRRTACKVSSSGSPGPTLTP